MLRNSGIDDKYSNGYPLMIFSSLQYSRNNYAERWERNAMQPLSLISMIESTARSIDIQTIGTLARYIRHERNSSECEREHDFDNFDDDLTNNLAIWLAKT